MVKINVRQQSFTGQHGDELNDVALFSLTISRTTPHSERSGQEAKNESAKGTSQ